MRFNITVKIWLSVGIFVLGYVLSTVLGQVQGIDTERVLERTSRVLFPAAQRSQEAEAGFQRVVKALGDAVIMQDATGLDHAAEEGRQVVQGLNAVAAIEGLAPERSAEARKLAGFISQFLADGKNTYGTMLSNAANLTAATEGRMRELALRTETIKSSLKQVKEEFSRDLHENLSALEASSGQRRWLSLLAFAMTLVLA